MKLIIKWKSLEIKKLAIESKILRQNKNLLTQRILLGLKKI